MSELKQQQVAGSKQYRSIVVQDRPERRWLIRLLLLATLVIVTLLSYWLGGLGLHADYQQLKADYQQTQTQLQDVSESYQQASQQLTNATVDAKIDRQAVNDVRSVISEHKQTINALNEEISFYKGLMAPTERERGLGIRSWEVYSANDGSYSFKLILQQLAVKHTVLKGSVSVTIMGKRGGLEQSYTLDLLSQQINTVAVKLRFKYFQYVEGELRLPAGFTPERIVIIAKSSTPKTLVIEKYYSWLVQNHG